MLDVAVVGAVGYALLLGVLYAFQRRLMYFPDRRTPEPAASGASEMTPVRLTTADGLGLLAWYRPNLRRSAPILVYFHGNAGHIGDRAHKVRPYLDAGLGVLLVSYRGYGGNPGSPSEAGLYADGRAALAYVAENGGAGARVVLYGESLGTGVAVRLAAEQAVAAVVLEAPFTSAVDVGKAAYPFLPVRLMLRDRFDSLSRISQVRAPLLVLHGERDRTVPVRLGRRLFAAAPEPKEAHFFPAAGHTDLHEFGAAETVLAFLARHGVA